MSDSVSRKDFVSIVGTVVAAEGMATAPPAEAAVTSPHKPPAPAKPKPLGTRPEAYEYFTPPEAAFVEAAVARLIPADALGPGAREAGVAYYIDQQLAGQYGYAAKMYTQGPWLPGLPTQGYQLPLNPRQVYRLGIADANDYCRKQYGKTFDALSSAQHQDDLLDLMDGSKIEFPNVPVKTFFEMLYANTVEGFFADPMYGGNRDMIGWRLVGFPGAAAAYVGFIGNHNKAYNVTPMGIADLQQAEQVGEAAGMDTMMVHTMIARKALGER